ncbi:MAG: ChrR family anti-sigma-E factor [Pseudomonadota bacterium]
MQTQVDDVLIEYGAGALSESSTLLVASHLALKPQSRRTVRAVESVGGMLLDLEQSQAIEDERFDLEATLDVLEPRSPNEGEPAASSVDFVIPEPLAAHVGMGLDQVPWRTVMPGLKEFPLPQFADKSKTKLMRFKAGAAMPHHTHEGRELTLVLWGGYKDETGHFVRGDMSVADASVHHRPVADPDEDCICLIVLEAPCRFTGVLGLFLNGLSRF